MSISGEQTRHHLLAAIDHVCRHDHRPPTRRELADLTGISPYGQLNHHLAILEQRGYIRRQRGHRFITRTDAP